MSLGQWKELHVILSRSCRSHLEVKRFVCDTNFDSVHCDNDLGFNNCLKYYIYPSKKMWLWHRQKNVWTRLVCDLDLGDMVLVQHHEPPLVLYGGLLIYQLKNYDWDKFSVLTHTNSMYRCNHRICWVLLYPFQSKNCVMGNNGLVLLKRIYSITCLNRIPMGPKFLSGLDRIRITQTPIFVKNFCIVVDLIIKCAYYWMD